MKVLFLCHGSWRLVVTRLEIPWKSSPGCGYASYTRLAISLFGRMVHHQWFRYWWNVCSDVHRDAIFGGFPLEKVLVVPILISAAARVSKEAKGFFSSRRSRRPHWSTFLVPEKDFGSPTARPDGYWPCSALNGLGSDSLDMNVIHMTSYLGLCLAGSTKEVSSFRSQREMWLPLSVLMHLRLSI